MGSALDNPAGGTPARKIVKPTKAQGCAHPDKIAVDTARYEALAREHGVDLNEEGFNEALRKVARGGRE